MLYLSSYNPGSPKISKDFKQLSPTSQDRSDSTQHIIRYTRSQVARTTTIGVQNKILQTEFVSQKQHSSIHNFMSLNTLPDSSHVHKSNLDKDN
jgi:hypothetical protein